MVLTDQVDGRTVTHFGRWQVSDGDELDGWIRPLEEPSALLREGRYIEQFSRNPENIEAATRSKLEPLERMDGFIPCTFCNDETHVRERGVVYSDYRMIDPDNDNVLGYTCHACVDE